MCAVTSLSDDRMGALCLSVRSPARAHTARGAAAAAAAAGAGEQSWRARPERPEIKLEEGNSGASFCRAGIKSLCSPCPSTTASLRGGAMPAHLGDGAGEPVVPRKRNRGDMKRTVRGWQAGPASR